MLATEEWALPYTATWSAFTNFTVTASHPNQTVHDGANVITTTVGGCLSMMGVIFITVSYFKLVEYRAGGTTAQTILLYISFADFLAASSNVTSVWFPQEAPPGCKASAFVIIFASTSSFLWTSCLALHLYLIIMDKNNITARRYKMLIFHLISWSIPLVLASIALGSDALGPSPIFSKSESNVKLTTGGWCWIRDFHDKSKTIAWTMMTSKVWELASYCLITFLCCAILIQLRRNIRTACSVSDETLVEARKLEKRMMFIPVAFILLRIWGTVRYFAYTSKLPIREDILHNRALYAMQGLGDSSQGFANSLFFCLSNKRVYEYWKFVLSDILPDFLCYTDSWESTNERTPILYNLNTEEKRNEEQKSNSIV
ncbi:G-protein coupled receptor 157-like [Xenia sp. Carnegie-2017]|uniref:G-protein coupled receptor 157-like n=1 Tax=Xenia sp. Carnegie-2017 TaxID=2897299 RepID=UPI001F0331AE|nr:G-protein coupled receptor 157-like [Xenia sp. Carnegie-2017]